MPVQPFGFALNGDVEGFWEDLRFPATAAKAITGKEPGVEDTGMLLFGSNATETVAFLAQMPHGWREGSELHPHIHWQKTTSAAGAVYWQVEYRKAPINEVMAADYTALASVTPVFPETDTADHHTITALAAIDMTDGQVSDCLLFKVSRVGGDASDTYGADVRFLEFDLHIVMDSWGSYQEYTKE